MSGFEEALKRLVEDQDYREAVATSPDQLTKDFERLEPQEILLLMQAWNATSDPEAAAFLRIYMCHCCCFTR
jgi:hypothetical protein